jgi:hypothetical protein
MIAALQHLLALARTWQGWIILAIVISQLLIPLHYYLPSQRDPHDERFAWRMFSPMRMAKCEPRFTLDGASLDLATQFHEAWVAIARRGRFHVIERMGETLCTKHPDAAVEVTLECTYVDKSRERYGGFNMCQVPLL